MVTLGDTAAAAAAAMLQYLNAKICLSKPLYLLSSEGFMGGIRLALHTALTYQ